MALPPNVVQLDPWQTIVGVGWPGGGGAGTPDYLLVGLSVQESPLPPHPGGFENCSDGITGDPGSRFAGYTIRETYGIGPGAVASRFGANNAWAGGNQFGGGAITYSPTYFDKYYEPWEANSSLSRSFSSSNAGAYQDLTEAELAITLPNPGRPFCAPAPIYLGTRCYVLSDPACYSPENAPEHGAVYAVGTEGYKYTDAFVPTFVLAGRALTIAGMRFGIGQEVEGETLYSTCYYLLAP